MPWPDRLKRIVFDAPSSLARSGFADGGGDGVGRFGSRYDTLGAGEEQPRTEGFELRNGLRLDQPSRSSWLTMLPAPW